MRVSNLDTKMIIVGQLYVVRRNKDNMEHMSLYVLPNNIDLFQMKHSNSNYPKRMKKAVCSSTREKMCMSLLKGISEKERHKLK